MKKDLHTNTMTLGTVELSNNLRETEGEGEKQQLSKRT